MSAEILRKAAALMRERAKTATPGPWLVLWNAVAYVDTVADPSGPTGQTPMQQPEKVADAADRDREHIASWHPAVALAVAKAMDDVAHAWEIADEAADGYVYDADYNHYRFEETVDGGWLAVARTYLGDDR